MTEPLTVGRRRQRVVAEEITRTQIVQFAGASGDYSPLHTDEVRAIDAGYPGVMAHGMMAMAAAATLVDDWVGAERVASFGARFRSPTWPGDRLTAAATVDSVGGDDRGRLATLSIEIHNDEGVVVLSGYATVRA